MGLTPAGVLVAGLADVGVALQAGQWLDLTLRLGAQSRPVLDTTTEHYNLRRLADHLGTLDAARLRPDDLVGYAQMRADEGAGRSARSDTR